MNTLASAPRRFRWLKILLVFLSFLVIIGAIALWVGIAYVKKEIVAALGPGAEIREVNVGFRGGLKIDLVGLRLPAEANWHARTLFEAGRVTIVLSISDLLHARLMAREIQIDGAFLSLRRSARGGLEFLPGSMSRRALPHLDVLARLLPKSALSTTFRSRTVPGALGAVAAPTNFQVERIELTNGVVEFFDVPVGVKLHAERVNASVTNLGFPARAGHTGLRIDGRLKGTNQEGVFHIEGQTEFTSQETQIRATIRDADLLDFKDYFLNTTDTSPERGSLDFDLESRVQQGALTAPVRLTLSGLVFPQEGDFMGIPANLVLSYMKEGNDEISLAFQLDGDLNDPGFALEKQFARRARAAFTKTLLKENADRLTQEIGKALSASPGPGPGPGPADGNFPLAPSLGE